MFYFNNNKAKLQTCVRYHCGNVIAGALDELSAWYAVKKLKDSQDSKIKQEYFICFEVNDAVKFDRNVYSRIKLEELNKITHEIRFNIVGGEIPLYEISIQTTARDSLVSSALTYLTYMRKDNNIRNIYSIMRCSPGYKLINDDKPPEGAITYAESRFHHLLKAMYQNPHAMLRGEIHFDMTDPRCYEYITPILVFCFAYDACETIKISLENITTTDRLNLCNKIYHQFKNDGYPSSLKRITRMLSGAADEIKIETNGQEINL